jgi:hypothetical protein
MLGVLGCGSVADRPPTAAEEPVRLRVGARPVVTKLVVVRISISGCPSEHQRLLGKNPRSRRSERSTIASRSVGRIAPWIRSSRTQVCATPNVHSGKGSERESVALVHAVVPNAIRPVADSLDAIEIRDRTRRSQLDASICVEPDPRRRLALCLFPRMR